MVKIKQIATSKMATKFEIQKFNWNNFSLWKMKIKAVLMKYNCIAAIDKRSKESTVRISSGKLNVCDDLYKTRHCTSSGSSQSIHGESRWRALECCEEDFEAH